MAEHPQAVSVERVIAATPDRIFDVLADPAQHPVIDGSGTVKHTRGETPARLSLGAKFGMSMKLGVPYGITNTVVEFEDGRRIAWRHFGGHRWRYELEPADGGTRVRETYDWSTSDPRYAAVHHRDRLAEASRDGDGADARTTRRARHRRNLTGTARDAAPVAWVRPEG